MLNCNKSNDPTYFFNLSTNPDWVEKILPLSRTTLQKPKEAQFITSLRMNNVACHTLLPISSVYSTSYCSTNSERSSPKVLEQWGQLSIGKKKKENERHLKWIKIKMSAYMSRYIYTDLKFRSTTKVVILRDFCTNPPIFLERKKYWNIWLIYVLPYT